MRMSGLDQLTLEEGVGVALDGLIQNKLASICGAGLSMAAPSNIPSAWTVAQRAKARYDGIYGATRPPLSEDIEEQANHFHALGQLSSMYLRQLVDHNTFSAPPNPGHYAIADFLLTRSKTMALSTNVDSLIESAGDELFGAVLTATTRDDASALFPEKAPLLKIHGCWKADHQNTIWAPTQLNDAPIRERIKDCANWATQQLFGRDLVIVGYFSDWNYLNDLFEECLGAAQPANVIVVDPSTEEQLREKAPRLFEVGENASGNFYHVPVSGADFLAELRKQWSMMFIRQVFTAGNTQLADAGDPRADVTHCEPPDADVDDLWAMRKDMEGAGPNDPCTMSQPYDDPFLGVAHVMLRSKGAQIEGRYWGLNGLRFRIIRGSGKALNKVEQEHSGSLPPLASPDVTIVAGARDLSLKANIARSEDASSVVRARPSRFMTDDQAESEFGLGSEPT